MIEDMVEKLQAAWMASLKHEGHRVVEYVLACYASRDPYFSLELVERDIQDVGSSGDQARALVSKAACKVASFIDP